MSHGCFLTLEPLVRLTQNSDLGLNHERLDLIKIDPALLLAVAAAAPIMLMWHCCMYGVPALCCSFFMVLYHSIIVLHGDRRRGGKQVGVTTNGPGM